MPRYEFSAWVTVEAATEQDARRLLDVAQIACESSGVQLSIEDGEPIVEDDDEEDGGGGSGVREPRRPHPSHPSMATAVGP